MNRSILFTALTVAALSAPAAFAQGTTPVPAKPGMGMDKQMPRMQENMKDMQLQMQKVHGTTDPAERQRLMQAHMLAMQENMKAMRGMGGPMMSGGMGGGMAMGGPKDAAGGGMAMGGTKDAAAGGMMQHHAMMEKRVDMMQMMMEQMVLHQQMTESMPGK